MLCAPVANANGSDAESPVAAANTKIILNRRRTAKGSIACFSQALSVTIITTRTARKESTATHKDVAIAM
jgi:hypothetical protein